MNCVPSVGTSSDLHNARQFGTSNSSDNFSTVNNKDLFLGNPSVIPINAMQGNAQNYKRFGQRKPLLCGYCGMTGHAVERYCKKHGFPPGYKFKNMTQAVNQTLVDVGDNQFTYV